MPRETANARLDIPEGRVRFARNLRDAMAALGVTTGQEKWLSEKIDVRWQTVQDWLLAKRFPLGHQLVQIGDAVRMDPGVLLGPLLDEVDPKWSTWREFRATAEGQSMQDLEAWGDALLSVDAPANRRRLPSVARALPQQRRAPAVGPS